MAIQEFLDGVTSVTSDHPLRAYDRLDPTKWSVFYDDFVKYDVAQGAVYYTFTQSTCVDTIVGPTGVLVLTCSGSDDDYGQLTLVETPFQLTSGKKAFFETRFKVNKGSSGTIGQDVWAMGLFSLQTTTNFMAADGLSRTMDDGWGFISYDATTNFDCTQGENDVFSTEVGADTYADDTWLTLSVYYDGAQSKFYKDDALIATLTTNEPTSVLTPTIYIEAGEAKAKVLNVDYTFVAVERD